MYCMYGESRSSLLIESTDSMIMYAYSIINNNLMDKTSQRMQYWAVVSNV